MRLSYNSNSWNIIFSVQGSADKTEKQSTETKRDETSRTPLSVPADSDAESPAYRKTVKCHFEFGFFLILQFRSSAIFACSKSDE